MPVPRELCHSLAGVTEIPCKGVGISHNFQKFRYEYGSLTELPEVPGIVPQAYITNRSSERVQNMLHPYPGYCGQGRTELPDIPGIVAQAYITHRSSERVQNMKYADPGYCSHGRTDLPEVPGTDMNIPQNF